jgi:hypothetical protein
LEDRAAEKEECFELDPVTGLELPLCPPPAVAFSGIITFSDDPFLLIVDGRIVDVYYPNTPPASSSSASLP